MLTKYLENENITVNNYEDACALSKILLNNGNAVMITKEASSFIISWIWCESDYADRNKVVFRNRADVETEMFEDEDENEEDKITIRGKWVDPESLTSYKCSACGMYVNQGYWVDEPIFWDYCPNCGADMRGRKDG